MTMPKYCYSMKFRLYLIFTAIVTFQLLATGIFAFNIVNKAIKSIAVQSAMGILTQVPRHISTIFNKIDNDTIIFLANTKLQDALSADPQLSNTQKILRNEDIHYALTTFSYSDEIDSVLLVDTSNRSYSYSNNYNISRSQEGTLIDTMKNMKLSEGQIKWAGTQLPENNLNKERNMITGFREIFDVDSDTIRGYLIVNVDESYIYNIYKGIHIGDTGIIYLLSPDGTIISHPDKSKLGSLINKSLLSQFVDSAGSITYRADNGEEMLLIYNKSSDAGFITLGEVPYREIMRAAYIIRCAVFIIGIVTIIIALVIAYLFLGTITRPLEEFAAQMKRTEEGDFSSRLSIIGSEEIQKLNSGYNSMIDRIQELIVQTQRKDLQKKEAEFHALQAQINPHFICNTLNSVKWMAQFHKMNNISDMVGALISLIYNSIGKGNIMITLREEIENLKNYVKIQEYRYNDSFEVFYNCEEAVLECLMLKFILQPLVENSIFHGMEKTDKCRIQINAMEKDGKLRIEIADNGVGMDNETIEMIMNSSAEELRARNYSSIGIKNIDKRIKLQYGSEYGVSIQSRKGSGTKVTISLPLTYKKEENK